MTDAPRPRNDWTARLGLLGFELAFLAAIYLLWIREPVLIGGIGVALIASALGPARFSSVIGGLVVVGVGVVDHLTSGRSQIPTVLGVLGGIIAAYGVFVLVTSRGSRAG